MSHEDYPVMSASRLIQALQSMPSEAKVWLLWDGASRSCAEAVWMSQNGTVIIGSLDDPIYEDSDRAIGSISAEEDRYLNVGEMLASVKALEEQQP